MLPVKTLRHRDSSFIGFGTTCREKAFLKLSWGAVCKPFCQFDHWHRWIQRTDVTDPLSLLHDRIGHSLIGVTNTNRQDATKEVEILVAVEISNSTSFASLRTTDSS